MLPPDDFAATQSDRQTRQILFALPTSGFAPPHSMFVLSSDFFEARQSREVYLQSHFAYTQYEIALPPDDFACTQYELGSLQNHLGSLQNHIALLPDDFASLQFHRENRIFE